MVGPESGEDTLGDVFEPDYPTNESKHSALSICFDRKGPEKSWGKFFAQCEVNALPTSVAVDEEGRMLVHGALSDVLTAAWRHRDKISEKK